MGLWTLHIVAIQGAAGWRTGVTLWLLILGLGGGFAYLAGEWQSPDGLFADLLLATAGAAIANLAASQVGGDIVAFIYDVRIFWAALGGLLVLCLVHDGVARWQQSRREPAAFFGLTGRSGVVYLIAWLSGWPSESGIVEGSYGGGLPVKLLPEALHYQVRAGPLRISRAVPLVDGLSAATEGECLLLSAAPGSAAAAIVERQISLAGVQPQHQARLFAERIDEVAGRADPDRSIDLPPLH